MTTKSRRRVLKGLGLALPAAWARPVVEAVVLPAHAQTSNSGSSTPDTCGGVPEGCYLIAGGTISWPGGAGPVFDVPVYDNSGCEGTPIQTIPAVVVASGAEAAQAALECAGPLNEFPTDPTPPEGCSFFGCFVLP